MSFLQRPNSDAIVDLSSRDEPGRIAAPLIMVAAVLAWLWPIGWKMPVGGDVTAFSIGLMAKLSEALQNGRLPLWNADWGFGFPGLAESQMGVYYPPHLLLYRFLAVEAAYTASLVLHTLWAALGAYWAARKFAVSPWGAALSGFSWAASGMFLVHLPHQWAATTGSWMPWTLGLAWVVAQNGSAVAGLMLAALMALQVLPGHFQFAFQTQVLVLAMAGWGLVDRPRGGRAAIRSAVMIAIAVAAMLPLTAMQLVPTLQLARSAETQRTAAYLAAFPSTPLHWISYVAPNLFHLSPLWRPLAWDPFHAMPEEHRPYVGLAALMLALGALFRGFRVDRTTRLLAWMLAVCLALSLGPYLPGFSLLVRLPGFSYFRAPSRWGLGAELALAWLAGKGFDSWRTWTRPGIATARFAACAAGAVAMVVIGVELAFVSTEGTGLPAVAGAYERAFKAMPWEGDPPFRSVMQGARRGPTDGLILTDLMRQGIDPRQASKLRLDRERRSLYVRELGETLGLLLVLVVLMVFMAKRYRGTCAFILMFAFVDLMLLSRHRAVQTAPIRSLNKQSTVLGRLATLPKGTRTIDGLRNLPMVAGVAPVAAYRTLDRPVLAGLVALAGASRDGSVPVDRIEEAKHAVGVSAQVFDPFETPPQGAEVIDDPTLAEWQWGAWSRVAPASRRYHFTATNREGVRAWFVPGTVEDSPHPQRVLEILASAQPAQFLASSPETFEVELSAEGPGTLIVSVLDDPEWKVSAPVGSGAVSPPRRLFGTPGGGAWQAVSIPSSGTWRVSWLYEGRAAKTGLIVSSVAWGIWCVSLGFLFRCRRFGVDRS